MLQSIRAWKALPSHCLNLFWIRQQQLISYALKVPVSQAWQTFHHDICRQLQ